MKWRQMKLSPFWFKIKKPKEYLDKFTNIFSRLTGSDAVFIVNPMFTWEDCPLVETIIRKVSEGAHLDLITVPPSSFEGGEKSLSIFKKLYKTNSKRVRILFRRNEIYRLEYETIASDSLHAKFIVIHAKKDPLSLIHTNQFSEMGFLRNDELCVPFTNPKVSERLLQYWHWLADSSNCNSYINGWISSFPSERKEYGPYLGFKKVYEKISPTRKPTYLSLKSVQAFYDYFISQFSSSGPDNESVHEKQASYVLSYMEKISMENTKSIIKVLRQGIGVSKIKKILKRVDIDNPDEIIKQARKSLLGSVEANEQENVKETWRDLPLDAFWTITDKFRSLPATRVFPDPGDHRDFKYRKMIWELDQIPNRSELSYGDKLSLFIEKTKSKDEIFLANPMIVCRNCEFVRALIRALQRDIKMNVITVPPRAFKEYMGRDVYPLIDGLYLTNPKKCSVYLRRNPIAYGAEVLRKLQRDTFHIRFILIYNRKDPVALLNSNLITSMGFITDNEITIPTNDQSICKKLRILWNYLVQKYSLEEGGWIQKYEVPIPSYGPNIKEKLEF